MPARNMVIFQKLLEKRILSLHQLQVAWEQTHKNLKYAEHKDLSKVVVSLGYMKKEAIEDITREIDGLPKREPEIKVRADNTAAFMQKMEEISKRMQKVDDDEVQENISNTEPEKVVTTQSDAEEDDELKKN